MVPDEGIIHPNVEHHILSRFFFLRFPGSALRFDFSMVKTKKSLRNCHTTPYCHSVGGTIIPNLALCSSSTGGYPKLSHQSHHRKRVAAQAMDRHTIPTDSPAASVTI